MIRLRAVFAKTDRAKYISHLDLNRFMLRTFRRSKLPVWYTEGFNPHPYYSFALALSLGFESECEILDFNLNEEVPFDEVKNRLNSVMPDGMKILWVREQKMKVTEIAKAEYKFSLSTQKPNELQNDIKLLFEGEQILIDKKTKKGIKTVDIKPDTEVTEIQVSENSVNMTVRLPAGTQTNYNPSLLFDALKNFSEIQFEPENIRRTAILCSDNTEFK